MIEQQRDRPAKRWTYRTSSSFCSLFALGTFSHIIVMQRLVHRLAYNGDVAAGSAADFSSGPSRTGGKAPISGFRRADPPRRRQNSKLAAAPRVALKTGRRQGGVGEASRFAPLGKKQSEDASPTSLSRRADFRRQRYLRTSPADNLPPEFGNHGSGKERRIER
jgi:hypothetical protein